jgi:hypothetical protein
VEAAAAVNADDDVDEFERGFEAALAAAAARLRAAVRLLGPDHLHPRAEHVLLVIADEWEGKR